MECQLHIFVSLEVISTHTNECKPFLKLPSIPATRGTSGPGTTRPISFLTANSTREGKSSELIGMLETLLMPDAVPPLPFVGFVLLDPAGNGFKGLSPNLGRQKLQQLSSIGPASMLVHAPCHRYQPQGPSWFYYTKNCFLFRKCNCSSCYPGVGDCYGLDSIGRARVRGGQNAPTRFTSSYYQDQMASRNFAKGTDNMTIYPSTLGDNRQ